MERGSYTAASGGLRQFRKLEVINNNLANVNTVGFKRQLITGETQSFDQTLASLVARSDPYARGDHNRTPGTININTITDFSPGPIKNTGNPFDVALRNPKDFFAVQTPNGIEYTRAGNFTLSETGQLVSVEGFPIVGDSGPITVTGPGAGITSNGTVASENEVYGALQVIRIAEPEGLERSGGTRFRLRQNSAQPTVVEASVIPQSVEMPNVSSISSVIDLITTNKAFDMYTKSAQTIDQMNQAAITQIGRPRG